MLIDLIFFQMPNIFRLSIIFLGCLRAPNEGTFSESNVILQTANQEYSQFDDKPPTYEEAMGLAPKPIGDTAPEGYTSRTTTETFATTHTDTRFLLTKNDFPEHYKHCHDSFVKEVLKKDYDPSFLVPCLDIANSEEIKKFLGIVGDIYKQLASLYIEKKNEKHIWDRIFNLTKVLLPLPNNPRPKSEKISEPQLRYETIEFMKNANLMAYKLILKLNIVKSGSPNYKIILLNWYNTAVICEKDEHFYKDLVTHLHAEGVFIVKLLHIRDFFAIGTPYKQVDLSRT